MLFAGSVNPEFYRVVRNGSALSVLFIDLDYFKQVNYTCGHPARDYVLVKVAQRIKEAVRTTDYLARYGGEGVAVVLSDTCTTRHRNKWWY